VRPRPPRQLASAAAYVPEACRMLAGARHFAEQVLLIRRSNSLRLMQGGDCGLQRARVRQPVGRGRAQAHAFRV